jgi:DNA-binding transcriptional regulator PaaX
MVEITLEGLNARQKVLADILWSIEEWSDAERFIATLPKREKAECESIVEMMKMELVESYRKGMAEDGMLPDNLEAKRVIAKFRLTK